MQIVRQFAIDRNASRRLNEISFLCVVQIVFTRLPTILAALSVHPKIHKAVRLLSTTVVLPLWLSGGFYVGSYVSFLLLTFGRNLHTRFRLFSLCSIDAHSVNGPDNNIDVHEKMYNRVLLRIRKIPDSKMFHRNYAIIYLFIFLLTPLARIA